jgi:SAM-dependent methyltransferase
MRVLDIGCGPAYIVEYLRGATYFGFDINSRYIAYAQKIWKPRKFLLPDLG